MDKNHEMYLKEVFYLFMHLLTPKELCRWFIRIAAPFEFNAKWHELLLLYRELLDILIQNSAEDKLICECNIHLGQALHETGFYQEAEEKLVAALKLTDGVNDNQIMLECLLKLAFFYKKSGDIEKAEHFSRQALVTSRSLFGEDHMSTLRAVSLYTNVLNDFGKHKEAEQFFRQMLEKFQQTDIETAADKSSLAALKHNLAGTLKAQEKYLEAESLYKQAIQLSSEIYPEDHPNRILAMDRLSKMYLDMERYEDAEKYARQVFETNKHKNGLLHPDTLIAGKFLGRSIIDQENHERYEDAFKVLDDVLKKMKETFGDNHKETNSCKYYWEKARQRKEWKKKAIKLNENPDWLAGLDDLDIDLELDDLDNSQNIKPEAIDHWAETDACIQSGNYIKALEHVNKVLEFGTKEYRHVYYAQRGIIFNKLNMFKDALADYTKAGMLNPEYGEAYLLKGMMNYGLNDLVNAYDDFSRYIHYCPEKSNGYKWRVCVALGMGKNYVSALSDINKAIKLDPDNDSYYFWRGMIYLEKEDHYLALEDFNCACELGFNQWRNFFWRGCAQKLLNLEESARKDFENTSFIISDRFPKPSDRIALYLVDEFSKKDTSKQTLEKQRDEIKTILNPYDLRMMLSDLKRLANLFPKINRIKALIQIVDDRLTEIQLISIANDS